LYCVALFVLLPVTVLAQGRRPADGLPRLIHKDGHYALMVNGAPYLMLGTQVNNSSAWPAVLPEVWPAVGFIHANTVEMPAYWNQFEPAEGHFDYSVMDTLITQARTHHVHLVLLWFGTWKNGSSHYMPLWLRTDRKRAPLVVGRDGQLLDSPSPFAESAMEADMKAFSTLMRHLKETDPQHTVLMVQVENEPGTWGSVRDFSPAANKLFAGPVPRELLSALHKEVSPGANWQQVFGDDADEFFHAWSVARYIQHVAAAGKAAYPLPLYINVALRDPLKPGRPPSYESGGATDNVMDIWKATAPAIDLLAPDIYMGDSERYLKVLDLYSRPDNPLFVPETSNRPEISRYFFAALGHGTIGFSPFGVDYTSYTNAPLGATRTNEETLAPFALNYELVGPMDREIARLEFEGKLQGVAERKGEPSEMLKFGDWTAVISYGLPQFGRRSPPGNPEPEGRALVARLGQDEFLVAGYFCRVDFRPSDAASGKQREFLLVEEGAYENGQFKVKREWNGDQTDWGLNFSSVPQVLRVKLGTF
jgi:beta-galactosidase GanA